MSVTESDLALDRELAQICGLIPLIRLVTPTNVPRERDRFFAGDDEPEFTYRDLPDLEAIKDRIDSLTSQAADDPVIEHMAEGLINELKVRLQLLSARETPEFFLKSVELYGAVEEDTLELARAILAEERVEPEHPETIAADELAAMARDEIELYRNSYPEVRAEVNVTESTSGVMVEAGHMYIGKDTRINEDRVVQLLHHEVGTHILTFENGLHQPLHILSLGLADYDELQEALGVLAEHLSGGIAPARLRILAYRVVAAHMRGEGAPFRETFRELSKLGCGQGAAFTTTMRAYRSGGLTKDAIYLRGFVRLLDYLASGGSLDLLFIGKISFESVALVTELREREVLSEPPLTPRYLDDKEALERLERIKDGVSVMELSAA